MNTIHDTYRDEAVYIDDHVDMMDASHRQYDSDDSMYGREVVKYIRQKYITDGMLQIEEEDNDVNSNNNSMRDDDDDHRVTVRYSHKKAGYDNHVGDQSKDLMLIEEGRKSNSSGKKRDKKECNLFERSRAKTPNSLNAYEWSNSKDDFSIRELKNQSDRSKLAAPQCFEDHSFTNNNHNTSSNSGVQRKGSNPNFKKKPYHSDRERAGISNMTSFLKKYTTPSSSSIGQHTNDLMRDISHFLKKNKQQKGHKKSTSMTNMSMVNMLHHSSSYTHKNNNISYNLVDESVCKREKTASRERDANSWADNRNRDTEEKMTAQKKPMRAEILEEMLNKQDKIIDLLLKNSEAGNTQNMTNERNMMMNRRNSKNEYDDDDMYSIKSVIHQYREENTILKQKVDLLIHAREEDMKYMMSLEERMKRMEYLLTSRIAEESKTSEKEKLMKSKIQGFISPGRSGSKPDLSK